MNASTPTSPIPPSLNLPAPSQSAEVVPVTEGLGAGMNKTAKSALGNILGAMNGAAPKKLASTEGIEESQSKNLDAKTAKGVASMLSAMDSTDELKPEVTEAAPPSKVSEGNVKEWITSKINGALISTGVPKEQWDSIEDAVFTAALSGELGDGLPSSETAEAIANMVTELTGTAAAPTKDPEPAMVIEPDDEPVEEPIEEPIAEPPLDAIEPEEEPSGDVDVELPDIPSAEDEIAAMIDVLANGEEELPPTESKELEEYGLGPAAAGMVGKAVGGVARAVTSPIRKVAGAVRDKVRDATTGIDVADDIVKSLNLPRVAANTNAVLTLLKANNYDQQAVTDIVSQNIDQYRAPKELLVPSAVGSVPPPPTPESYKPGQKVIVQLGDELIEATIVDVEQDIGYFDTGDGILREADLSCIDALTIDESYIEQVLEGKDIIEIIDSLVNEETLRRC